MRHEAVPPGTTPDPSLLSASTPFRSRLLCLRFSLHLHLHPRLLSTSKTSSTPPLKIMRKRPRRTSSCIHSQHSYRPATLQVIFSQSSRTKSRSMINQGVPTKGYQGG